MCFQFSVQIVRTLLAWTAMALVATGGLSAQEVIQPAAPQQSTSSDTETPPADPKLNPTHEQTAIIKTENDQGETLPLTTFCLDTQGNILAGVGAQEGEIRVFDPDGKYLKAWPVPVKPEAVHAAADGTVYVAGNGKLLKYDKQGKLLLDAEAPHVTAIRSNASGLREQVIAQAKARAARSNPALQREVIQRALDQYQKQIDTLSAKGEEALTELERQRIEGYQRVIETYTRMIESLPQNAQQNAYEEPTEEEIQEQIERMIAYKMQMASISATSEDVFIVSRAAVGYGFEIWRTDLDFQNGESIVSELRGCCGQMDAQACPKGLFVAENGRFRVCRYDREGEMICTWGKGDRQGVVGFGSCCNPMNVTFGPNGDVYTAEASLGRIKRFSPDGEFLGLVGSVEIVPGCKKVSIAVNDDGSRVYMLDITRNHIVMMQRKPDTAIAAVD
jgi:sugar lactone lactonase YvrE